MQNKCLAYYPLHYGKEHLAESIKSIEPFVDRIVILYTSTPSYGKTTILVCPDTREELYTIAFENSKKIEWIDIEAGNEGQHRGNIWNYFKGEKYILPLDSDEVWNRESLEKVLSRTYIKKNIGIRGFIHFWKNKDYICTDHFTPIRLLNPSGEEGEEITDGTIYHYGYAISQELMEYKWAIHGHKDELKNGWLEMYKNWKPGINDVHPVVNELWNPKKSENNGIKLT